MKRVIITGATGFVGANLARRLLSDDHQIHLLVRRNYIPWRIKSIHDKVHLHEVDLINGENLDATISKIKPHWVFHLATCGAYSHSDDLHRILKTNIIGTANLVEACLKTGFEAFINTGSSSEYGFKDHPPVEDELLEPNSYYAVAKASATQFCRYISQTNNVNLSTLRLYSVYGPYEGPTRLIPKLIVLGLEGKLPPLVNPGVAHDFIHVEDVVEAYILAATKSGQKTGAIYNVGTGIQTTLEDVVSIACQVMDIKVEPKWGSMLNRQWDTDIWVSDSQKIQRELGFQARYTFKEGFGITVDWLHNNREMLNFYKNPIL